MPRMGGITTMRAYSRESLKYATPFSDIRAWGKFRRCDGTLWIKGTPSTATELDQSNHMTQRITDNTKEISADGEVTDLGPGKTLDNI